MESSMGFNAAGLENKRKERIYSPLIDQDSITVEKDFPGNNTSSIVVFILVDNIMV